MNLNLPPIGTSKKIKGLENVFALNGFSDGLSTLGRKDIYKYMKIDYFKDGIDKKEFVFVSPEEWFDKYERRFLFTKFDNPKYEQKKMRCACFTSDRYWGEEAGWKSYGFGSDGKVVRFKVKFDVLLKFLNEYATKVKAKIYIGEAMYGLAVKEINEIHKIQSPYYKVFFPRDFKDENYLSLMLLKRKAFSYENEIRIFIYYDTVETSSTKRPLLEKVPVNYEDIISEIYISPLLDEKEKKKEMEDINKRFSNVKVSESRLYQSGCELASVPCDKEK